MLATVLLFPAFYFYLSFKAEAKKTTEQLASQLVSSIKSAISKPLLYGDHFSAWQLINNQIKNNQQQLNTGGLLKIKEIAILNKEKMVFAHNAPEQNPIQTHYAGLTPSISELPLTATHILTTYPADINDNRLRLYANAIYQGNLGGLIILEMDLSLINQANDAAILKFIIFFFVTMICIIISGNIFARWISTPINTIEKYLTDLGNGSLDVSELKKRHDEFKNLALAIEQTDADLFNSHSKIDLLLNSTAEAIYGVDLAGNCTFVNQACINMLNYNQKSDFISQNMHHLLHTSKQQETSNPPHPVDQKTHIENQQIWRKDGSHFYIEYWSHPIYQNNNCIGAVVTFLDITARKKTLNKLKAREKDLSTMLHSIGDAVIATDANGLITRMNPVAEKLTGWHFQEAKGQQVRKIFPIIDSTTRKPINNPIDKVMSSGEIVYLSNHTTLISKTGKEYHIADSAAPIQDTNDIIQGMILIFNDVSEQYTLRAEIKNQKDKLQNIFNDMQSIVMLLDTNGTITFTNNTPLKLGNITEHDVIGIKLWNLSLCNYDIKTQENIKNNCFEAAADNISFSDVALNTPNGLFWIALRIHPIKNKAGDIIQLVAEGSDINTRKEQEDVLRRSQKMDAIGQLAGGIAHDFNNQLGVVIGYLDILQSSISDEDQLSWIEKSSKATLRCIDLTRQLLTFSRNKSGKKSTVDVNSTLTELQTMITRTVTPQVEVEFYLDDSLWLTEINAGDFQDAILNLVINARDVMPNGGKLIFETSNKELDSTHANNHLNISAGHYIQIMISDTGFGMSKQTLDRIFEPFFTTKEEGKGTGLGLAMVYSFVKRFGGGIRFYSEVDIGTTLRMYLPRSEYSSPNKEESDTDCELLGGNEVILVVDDESDLLELACKYLTDLGYQIRKAETAKIAIKVLESDDSIDLLFSDIVMPGGMNGYELAEHTLKHHPEIKILLTSGFTSRVNSKQKPLEFDNKLLSKPYRKAELAKHIRLTLDETSQ